MNKRTWWRTAAALVVGGTATGGWFGLAQADPIPGSKVENAVWTRAVPVNTTPASVPVTPIVLAAPVAIPLPAPTDPPPLAKPATYVPPTPISNVVTPEFKASPVKVVTPAIPPVDDSASKPPATLPLPITRPDASAPVLPTIPSLAPPAQPLKSVEPVKPVPPASPDFSLRPGGTGNSVKPDGTGAVVPALPVIPSKLPTPTLQPTTPEPIKAPPFTSATRPKPIDGPMPPTEKFVFQIPVKSSPLPALPTAIEKPKTPELPVVPITPVTVAEKPKAPERPMAPVTVTEKPKAPELPIAPMIPATVVEKPKATELPSVPMIPTTVAEKPKATELPSVPMIPATVAERPKAPELPAVPMIPTTVAEKPKATELPSVPMIPATPTALERPRPPKPDPITTIPTPGVDPMMKQTTIATVIGGAIAILSSAPAPALPLPPKPLTPAITAPALPSAPVGFDAASDITALQNDLKEANKKLETAHKEIKRLVDLLEGDKEQPTRPGALAEIKSLKDKVFILEEQVKALKQSTSLKPTVDPKPMPVDPLAGKGTVRIVNDYPVEIIIVVNTISYRVAPNTKLDVPVATGDFTYQLLNVAGNTLNPTKSPIKEKEVVTLRIK